MIQDILFGNYVGFNYAVDVEHAILCNKSFDEITFNFDAKFNFDNTAVDTVIDNKDDNQLSIVDFDNVRDVKAFLF